MMIRMRRQPSGEIDASTIEQRAERRDSDEHGRIAVFDHADRRLLVQLILGHSYRAAIAARDSRARRAG